MLLRLRQACDHPLLVKGLDSNSLGGSSIEMAKKLPQEKQLCLLKCLEASLAICGICSVCHFFSCPITLLISTFAFSLSCNFIGLFPYINFHRYIYIVDAYYENNSQCTHIYCNMFILICLFCSFKCQLVQSVKGPET